MLEAVPWENPTYGILGGAAGNVAYGGTVNPPRNRKGGAGNPPPTGARASALPDTKRGRFFDTLEPRVRKRRCRRCGRKFTPIPGSGEETCPPYRRETAAGGPWRECAWPGMRATSQVAEPSPSCCTASESGVRSRRCADRCFATESRIPTAKHCGMFRHEPRGACVRRSGGLARRFRHQTGCGCNQAQTIGGEAVAGAPGFRHRAGACVSHAQGRQRNAGGADRADPIFHPKQRPHYTGQSVSAELGVVRHRASRR